MTSLFGLPNYVNKAIDIYGRSQTRYSESYELIGVRIHISEINTRVRGSVSCLICVVILRDGFVTNILHGPFIANDIAQLAAGVVEGGSSYYSILTVRHS